MRIESYAPGDEKAILELFKLSFGTEMSPAYWNWRFQENPAGKHKIHLMWDGDVLAGHYAVSPVTMLVDGEEVPAALSMTTMTHPQYAGRGIFTLLAESLYQEMQETWKNALVWGFPNNNSHYGFIKNLRWRALGLIPNFSAPASRILAVPAKETNSSSISRFSHFDERHERAFISLNTYAVSTYRSAQYLRWRYLQNPVNTYTLFEQRDADQAYFAVAKVYTAGGSTELDVVELQFPAALDLLQALFRKVVQHYADLNPQKINLWLPLHDPKHILLEKLGFVNGIPITYMGARVLSDKLNVGMDISQWNFSMGDSDVY